MGLTNMAYTQQMARKRAQAAKAKKACPVLQFVRSPAPISLSIKGQRIEAWAGKKAVGALTLVKRTEPVSYAVSGVPYVSHIEVDDKHQRCGVGTQLYQQAAKLVCAMFRQPLHSDRQRSKSAQGFWSKQVAKGRAVCVRAATARDVE